MASGTHSRRRRGGNQSDILDRLTRVLRILIGRSGPRPRGQRPSRNRSHRHSSASHDLSPWQLDGDFRHWTVRREVSFLRLGAIGLLLLAALWIGWRIVADTAAQNMATLAPHTALIWNSGEVAALDQQAQQILADPDGDLDAAQNWAQRALQWHPLDERALSLLGLIAERKGDRGQADLLMRRAGARSWRDMTTHAWLFDRDFRAKDYAQALQQIDAIMRVAPLDLRTRLFPALAAFTVEPRAVTALTDFLAESPPWRSWLLLNLSIALANKTRLDELYAALQNTRKPPTAAELAPYLNRLIKDGDYTLAHRIWQATLPASQRANEKYPYNRDFDSPIDGMPFNWTLETIPGADIQIVVAPDGGQKRALLVEFSGARVSFANVRQLMLLPPGRYNFSGKVKTEALQTSRGLWWRLYCAETPRNTLGQTDLVSGTMPWTDFSVDFTVPDQECTAQRLQLELPARVASEMQIEGQVWYQYLRIIAKDGGIPRVR